MLYYTVLSKFKIKKLKLKRKEKLKNKPKFNIHNSNNIQDNALVIYVRIIQEL